MAWKHLESLSKKYEAAKKYTGYIDYKYNKIFSNIIFDQSCEQWA